MTKIIKLEKIIIYPVKSCKGIEVDQCQVTKSGLELDRRFVIIDKDNKMITGRNFPKTVTIVPKIIQENDETIVELSYEGFETLKLTTDTNKIKQTTEGSLVKIWDNDVHAYYMGDEAASWVSKVLDTEAKIYMKGENVREPLNVELGHLEFVPNFNFADKYPFNFVSYSSIQNIQKELPSDELKNTVNETNFRPNLVFSGSDPHEEDRWAEVKVGDLKFEGAEPCSRCMFPNVNPENGIAHPTEPSKTMMKHRRVYPNISRFRSFMGAHFIHTNEGALKVGDLVTVLKEQDPAQV